MMFKKALLTALFGFATLAQAQTVTFAIGEWEPYTGETVADYGLSAKVVTKACEKAGITCEYEFMPWKRAYNMAMKGRVIGTFPWSSDAPERQEKFFPSVESVSDTTTVFFHKKDVVFPAGGNKDFNKLDGLPLVGMQGYTNSEALKKMGVKIHLVSDSAKAWKMIEKGRAGVLPDDIQVGKAECQKYAPTVCEQMMTSEPIRSSPMHILFTRVDDNAKAIREKIDAALKAMKESGEYAAIMGTK